MIRRKHSSESLLSQNKIYNATYRLKHKVFITIKKSLYYQKNKAIYLNKYKCTCGVEVSYIHKNRHEESNRHKEHILYYSEPEINLSEDLTDPILWVPFNCILTEEPHDFISVFNALT